MTLSFVQQALIHEEQKLFGELGHSSDSSTTSALMGEQRKCFGCYKIGHIRRDCPKRKSKSPHKAKAAREDYSDSDTDDGAEAFAATTSITHKVQWLIDSGASSHMAQDKELLSDYKDFEKPEKVGLGDGRTVDAVGSGKVYVNMLFKVSDHKKAVLYNVLYVPNLTCNLFSVKAAVSKGNFVKFGPTKCWIRNSKGNLCAMGSLADKLYQLDCEVISRERATVVSEQRCDMDLWHQRLGHLNGQRLKEIVQKELVTGIKVSKTATLPFCEGCVEGKMHRKPFKPVGEIRSTRKLQLVHSDVCGPMPSKSMGGQKYFVTFIDDYSRCCNVYFMRHKSEVLDKFKEFEAITTNDCGQRIGTLRSDNGGEYLSKEFQAYTKSKGIRHELTIPHSPEQNGVAERMNRTLLESARSMIAHAGLPNSYWAEAVATAAYVRNRMPTTAIKENITPYERWYGRKPDVSRFRVFGCMAYAHVPDAQRQKLDKKAEKFRFVGYSKESKGYRLLDERTVKVFKRRDVTFNESDFGLTRVTAKPDSTMEVETKSEEANRPEQEQIPEEEEHHRPERQRRPPVCRYGYSGRVRPPCCL